MIACGACSYIASLGYLAALHQLGLMPKVRYISGISGGSWATLMYSYAQNSSSDDVLLGPIVPPELIVERRYGYGTVAVAVAAMQ